MQRRDRPARGRGARAVCAALLAGALCGCAEEPDAPARGDDASASAGGSSAPRELARLPDGFGISDLRRDPEDPDVVLVAGCAGLARVRLASGERLAGGFSIATPPLLPTRLLDVDGDGTLELVRVGRGWTGPTQVYERDGRLRWSDPRPCRGEPADLDGDGRLELFLCAPNDPRTVCRGADGAELWRATWDANADCFPGDVDGDGTPELLWTDGAAAHVCDAGGVELRRLVPEGGGHVNVLRLVTAAQSGLDEPRLLVGAADRDGHQAYSWYAADLSERRYAASEEEAATMVDLVPLGAGGRMRFARVDELMEQAFPAGYERARLRLRLLDERRRVLVEELLAPGDAELGHGGGALLVLDADAPRLLVGYGPSLYELAPPR